MYSEGVNGAGEYSCCIVVNAACCTHLPTSKNLPHVIDLLAPVADLKVLGGAIIYSYYKAWSVTPTFV